MRFRYDGHGTYVQNIQLFWLIEYLKRNEELQKVRDEGVRRFIAEFPNEEGDPEDGLYYHDDGTPLFKRPITGEVDKIVQSLIDNTFTGEVHYWFTDDFTCRGVWFQILDHGRVPGNGPEIIASFQLGTPKELVLNDISLFMDNYLAKDSPENTDNCKFIIDSTMSPQAIGIASSESYKNITEMRYNKVSDIPRAIGLWLFDYIKENGSTQAEAIKELEETGYLPRLMLNPATEDLRFYLRRTRACIDAKKLLPFTKKGTQKIKLVPGTKHKT